MFPPVPLTDISSPNGAGNGASSWKMKSDHGSRTIQSHTMQDKFPTISFVSFLPLPFPRQPLSHLPRVTEICELFYQPNKCLAVYYPALGMLIGVTPIPPSLSNIPLRLKTFCWHGVPAGIKKLKDPDQRFWRLMSSSLVRLHPNVFCATFSFVFRSLSSLFVHSCFTSFFLILLLVLQDTTLNSMKISDLYPHSKKKLALLLTMSFLGAWFFFFGIVCI